MLRLGEVFARGAKETPSESFKEEKTLARPTHPPSGGLRSSAKVGLLCVDEEPEREAKRIPTSSAW